MTFSSSSEVDGAASRQKTAMIALVAGAVAMGVSPVFVRLAEVGPFASAFWRVVLALPLLWAWACVEEKNVSVAGGKWSFAVIAGGVFFAGDLLFWHLAIMKTTIANATFLATLAPLWVLLGARFILKEKTSSNMWVGLLICLAGAAGLVGSSFGFAPEHLAGDGFGLVTSVFFGSYLIATRYVRRMLGPGGFMFRSSCVTALVLGIVAILSETHLFPTSWQGIMAIVSLAFLAHVAGQGLVALALGGLSAGFSALVIFLEAVTAAVFAWVALGEELTFLQISGGALILWGIWVSRPQRSSRHP